MAIQYKPAGVERGWINVPSPVAEVIKMKAGYNPDAGVPVGIDPYIVFLRSTTEEGDIIVRPTAAIPPRFTTGQYSAGMDQATLNTMGDKIYLTGTETVTLFLGEAGPYSVRKVVDKPI